MKLLKEVFRKNVLKKVINQYFIFKMTYEEYTALEYFSSSNASSFK